MFIQMLKNQRVTFVSDVEAAEKSSPFYHWYNSTSKRYVVSKRERHPIVTYCEVSTPVAAGMELEEAQACVMFKANEWIYNNIQGAK